MPDINFLLFAIHEKTRRMVRVGYQNNTLAAEIRELRRMVNEQKRA